MIDILNVYNTHNKHNTDIYWDLFIKLINKIYDHGIDSSTYLLRHKKNSTMNFYPILSLVWNYNNQTFNGKMILKYVTKRENTAEPLY